MRQCTGDLFSFRDEKSQRADLDFFPQFLQMSHGIEEIVYFIHQKKKVSFFIIISARPYACVLICLSSRGCDCFRYKSTGWGTWLAQAVIPGPGICSVGDLLLPLPLSILRLLVLSLSQMNKYIKSLKGGHCVGNLTGPKHL